MLDIWQHEMFGVDSSGFARKGFMDLYDKAPDLRETAQGQASQFPLYENMQYDTYNWFHRGAPRVKGLNEVSSAIEPHLHILNSMQGSEELKKLKGMTVRNPLASLVAVRRLKDVVDNMPEELKDAIGGHQNQMLKARRDKRALENLRTLYRDVAKEEAQAKGRKKKKLQKQLEQIQQQGLEARKKALNSVKEAGVTADNMRQSFDTYGDDLRVAMRQGMEQATQDISDIVEALDAFGCGDGDSTMSTVGLKEQLELAKELMDDEELKRIARLAGRIQRIVDRAKRNKSRHGSDTIVDVVLGKRINRLTGGEKAKLAHPALKRELMVRLLDGKALNWQKEAREPEGLGPVVCCVDNSGSMSGEEIIWAKAVALVQYREAAKRKQPFYYIAFSDEYSDKVARSYADYKGYEAAGESIAAVVQKFEAQPGEEKLLMQFSKIFLNGGTDFPLAFRLCLEAMGDTDFRKADVTFISDMCFPISRIKVETDKFQHVMDENEAACWAVYIGREPDEADVESFKAFADGCWAVDPYKKNQDESCLTELFSEMQPEGRAERATQGGQHEQAQEA